MSERAKVMEDIVNKIYLIFAKRTHFWNNIVAEMLKLPAYYMRVGVLKIKAWLREHTLTFLVTVVESDDFDSGVILRKSHRTMSYHLEVCA